MRERRGIRLTGRAFAASALRSRRTVQVSPAAEDTHTPAAAREPFSRHAQRMCRPPEAARVPRERLTWLARLAGRRGRSDQVDLTRTDLLPSSLSIADAGALTELLVLAREEAMTILLSQVVAGQQRLSDPGRSARLTRDQHTRNLLELQVSEFCRWPTSPSF